MPVYGYECKRCGLRFEKRQTFWDKPQAACPRCESKAQRVIFPSPVIFKGSGFYVTDHRKSEPGGNGKGDLAKKTGEKTEKKS